LFTFGKDRFSYVLLIPFPTEKERWGGDLIAHFTGKNILENDIQEPSMSGTGAYPWGYRSLRKDENAKGKEFESLTIMSYRGIMLFLQCSIILCKREISTRIC
jgi:hypothetical protein